VAFDPVAGGGDACRETEEETAPGTFTVTGPPSRGYTLLGLPTVRATIATTGPFGQLNSRLWDVSPDGTQLLVSRGAYRLTDGQSGRVDLQLHGNGWCFAPGHRPKLELVGKDAPFLRPSNGAFTMEVSDVHVGLPIAEARPGGCARAR
jgi:predicted acyl esterase